MYDIDDLISKLHVSEIDTKLFSGAPLKMGLKRIFGGQILSQALNAAARTVDEDRLPHSLHGYFLRPGDTTRDVIFEVEAIRDGRSFATRRVVAKQRGEAIFNSSVSFHKMEDGLEHQMDMPDGLPRPEDLDPDVVAAKQIVKNIPGLEYEQFVKSRLLAPTDVIDIRTPHLETFLRGGELPPTQGFWFKFGVGADTAPLIHRTLLTFISDKALMSTGLLPHDVSFQRDKLMGASLDHAMWFHAKIRTDDWIYYHMDSPRASRARNFNRGSFYDANGVLIASTAQEGLARLIERGPR